MCLLCGVLQISANYAMQGRKRPDDFRGGEHQAGLAVPSQACGNVQSCSKSWLLLMLRIGREPSAVLKRALLLCAVLCCGAGGGGYRGGGGRDRYDRGRDYGRGYDRGGYDR